MLNSSYSKSAKLWIGVCLIFISGHIYAQGTLPDKRITLDATQVSLENILQLISKQTGISFSYNPKKIPMDQLISYKWVDEPLKNVLLYLEEEAGLSFSFVEEQIVVQPVKRVKKREEAVATLSGYIREEGSGESLIGASIFVNSLSTGVSANKYGFYSLTLPKGVYEVTYSYIGFESETVSVDLTHSIVNNLRLKPSIPVLQEVIIKGDKPRAEEEVQLSKTNLKPETVSEMPALFSEKDVLKSLESVPGVKLHSDGSTFFSVRGGYKDQNLILIDEAPIYNPSHMLGFFSTIIPDAVNDITLYKGDMPASLGGRLSSVMDIRTRKGNDTHYQLWGNVGMISNKLSVEGPIKKHSSSFLLSGRISRIKWFFETQDKNLRKLNFYDLTGKVNFTLNKKNNLYFSFYKGADNFAEINNGINWSNTAATLRWNRISNDRLFMNTTLCASDYHYDLITDAANNTLWKSRIANATLKSDLTYFIKPDQNIIFGIGANGHNFNPGNVTSDDPEVSFPVVSVRNATELVAYAGHEFHLGKHLGVKYGVRLATWLTQGESFEFTFDSNGNPLDTTYYKNGEIYNTYIRPEPRLTISYLFGKQTSIKASYTRNVQNIHLITNSLSPFTSLEVWLPSSIHIKPQIADQVTLGYYKYIPVADLSFETEAYYKEMQNQIDYEAHAETLLNPLVESELRFGKGRAYGFEMQLKKEGGRLRGWIGYSWSRSKRKFPDINNGITYNSYYDRPHAVNIVLNYDVSLRWNLGLSWNYFTGAPFSSPTGFFYFNGLETPIYGQKNNDRLPDYHRLDISSTIKLNRESNKKYRHTLTFSLYNVYGRKNPLFINFNKVENQDGKYTIPSNLLDKSSVTTQFYLFRIVPSFSYNFWFL